MKPTLRRLKRRAGGFARDRAMQWQPEGAARRSMPSMLTMGEQYQMHYSPTPPERTVEYLEDFGGFLISHIEFYPRHKDKRHAHPDTMLAYSETEYTSQRLRLARLMQDCYNRYFMNEESGPSPTLTSSLGHETGMGGTDSNIFTKKIGDLSVKYVFDLNRMMFVEWCMDELLPRLPMYQAVVDDACVAAGEKDAVKPKAALWKRYGAVIEAAAILHGCDTDGAKEAWLAQLGSLDKRTLDLLRENVQNAQEADSDVTIPSSLFLGDEAEFDFWDEGAEDAGADAVGGAGPSGGKVKLVSLGSTPRWCGRT